MEDRERYEKEIGAAKEYLMKILNLNSDKDIPFVMMKSVGAVMSMCLQYYMDFNMDTKEVIEMLEKSLDIVKNSHSKYANGDE